MNERHNEIPLRGIVAIRVSETAERMRNVKIPDWNEKDA